MSKIKILEGALANNFDDSKLPTDVHVVHYTKTKSI